MPGKMRRELETDRLTAAPLSEENREGFAAVFRSPECMRTLGGLRTEEKVQALFEFFVDHWSRHGYGVWIFQSKESGDFVGYCGLKLTLMQYQWRKEILYAVLPEYWGKGYATEMAERVAAWGFELHCLREIYAITLSENAPSCRVLEKLGMETTGETTHAGLPHLVYRLGVKEWTERQKRIGL